MSELPNTFSDKGWLPLDTMKPGECGYIRKVIGSGAIRRRMLDMGLIEGILVKILKYAPLGDPIEVCVTGTHLCLRHNEAAGLIIEKVDGGSCDV